ncbi:Melanotransferrin [Stylophora pistillata]|uniref:Melanotransferrin n=1 Tax=Stylophora pistillata TaxID=50429 RepID=A0A2B4SL84_STYPI|nr:Melanotransferrin [Stylophora pistillata]
MLGPLTFLSALVFVLGHGHATHMRWCTIKDQEQKKCQDFEKVLMNISSEHNMTLEPKCVQGSNAIDCMEKIKNGEADLITLDGGEIYVAGKNYDMTPVVAESYGEPKYMTQDSTCNPYVSAGNYFAKSCVPRVKEAKIDTTGKNPRNLCELCPMECDKDGEYSGYSGAFKCLVNDVGEVAFVKHTTVASEPNAKADDYMYLCYNGNNGEIGQHVRCNLAKVPAHAVMTKKGHSNKATYINILLKASMNYGNDAGDGFRMFDSSKYANGKDLLFKDSTEKLVDVSDQSYE